MASAIGDAARNTLLATPLEAGPSAAGAQARAGPIYDDPRDAIRRRDVLRIDYVGLSGKRSSRLARPLGLTAFDESWLLTIWCEAAQDFRHLRLDRIDSCDPTGHKFRHEKEKRFSDALKREREKLAKSLSPRRKRQGGVGGPSPLAGRVSLGTTRRMEKVTLSGAQV